MVLPRVLGRKNRV
ncbi:hypothetical protein DMN91_006512 [Ooceraea biroi]|uniref:Uncharacterized protein n=1 Tax=Ooceraea biroi TaxID=2015173 RepID=A0A3L8DPG4_OOCBI|nr:hypothetical protein DMN91_006512 [Ooceraea biroi]